MNHVVLTAVFVLALGNPALYGQTPDPLSFFPHHLGDIWEYVDFSVVLQNRILSDSLALDGRYYLTSSMFGDMRVDTTLAEVHSRFWGGSAYGNVTYKLASDSGDSWTVTRQGDFVVLAHVVAVYEMTLFGTATTVKVIDYVDSANGLLYNTDYLARDFGLIGQDFDGFPGKRIRGAIINGMLYGTVSVEEEPKQNTIPLVMLLQNYPNPFNPSTTISLVVPRRSHVKLTVYDILGQHVTTLVDEEKESGSYLALLQAHSLSSGVYFYRLEVGVTTITKKMIVQK